METTNPILSTDMSQTDVYLMFPWSTNAVYTWWFNSLWEVERQSIEVEQDVLLAYHYFLTHFPIGTNLVGSGPTLTRISAAMIGHVSPDWPHPPDLQTLITTMYIHQTIGALGQDTAYGLLTPSILISPVEIWAMHHALDIIELDWLPAFASAHTQYPFATTTALANLIATLRPLVHALSWIGPIEGCFRIAATEWPANPVTEPDSPLRYTVTAPTTPPTTPPTPSSSAL